MPEILAIVFQVSWNQRSIGVSIPEVNNVRINHVFRRVERVASRLASALCRGRRLRFDSLSVCSLQLLPGFALLEESPAVEHVFRHGHEMLDRRALRPLLNRSDLSVDIILQALQFAIAASENLV